jgi:hypothetical protein
MFRTSRKRSVPSFLALFVWYVCHQFDFVVVVVDELKSQLFDSTQLLHKKIRDTFMHPQFNTDVSKPMMLEPLLDQGNSFIDLLLLLKT